MKLLFDENLSDKLVGILAYDFPGCVHVRDLGLRAAEDAQIWDHARLQGLVIVSKDTDFRERSYVEGFPPKIIWLDATVCHKRLYTTPQWTTVGYRRCCLAVEMNGDLAVSRGAEAGALFGAFAPRLHHVSPISVRTVA